MLGKLNRRLEDSHSHKNELFNLKNAILIRRLRSNSFRALSVLRAAPKGTVSTVITRVEELNCVQAREPFAGRCACENVVPVHTTARGLLRSSIPGKQTPRAVP